MPPLQLLEDGSMKDGSRGWHDRRWADGEVPEKIRKISGWKRAMKKFMSHDPKLNDLVALFTQKFVQLGQSKNFTLSTLMDMAWTVLILTWEAVITEQLPMVDEVERGFKEKYEDLKETMTELRRSYLEEIGEHRDRIRRDTLSPALQVAMSEITGDGEDHSIYRLQPEIALDAKTQEYFKATMVENLKIAISKGASAAGETVQLLMAQLAEAQAEIERLKAELEDALLQVKLSNGREKIEKPVKRESRPPAVVDDSEAKRLQAELDALRAELDQVKSENDRFRQMLQALGIDPNSSLDDIRRMLREREGPKDTGEDEQKAKERMRREQELAARNAELERKIALLEKQIQDLQNKPVPSDTGNQTRELNSKIKELQEEVERLKKALADNQSAKPDTSKADELRKRNEELEKQLAMLKKQLNAKGDSGQKELLKRNEELEKEVSKLNSKIDLLNKELAASKRAEANARQDLEEAESKLSQLRKELAQVKAELEEALDALGNQKDAKPRREAPKVETPSLPASNDDEAAAVKAELAQANLKVSKLQKQLKELKDQNDKLLQENQELKDALEEANLMRKALEAAMEELRAKFEEFKKKLVERGVDVSLLDEALAAAGMPLNPMSVFDRLYMDALRRHRRMQEKYYVDMRNAQQETWERILGVHRGPALSKEQLEALIADGIIEPRLLAGAFIGQGEALAPGLGAACPHCGSPGRSPHARESSPQHEPPDSRQKLGRLRTSSSDALEERHKGPDLALDIIGRRTVGGPDRKPFALVSEAEQWRQYHQLQSGEDPPEFANPLARSRSRSPEARPLSHSMPARLSRRQKTEAGSRASSPNARPSALHERSSSPLSSVNSKPQSGMSQTHPLAGAQSVFEFPGMGSTRDTRAPRTPSMPLARTPGNRYLGSRETAVSIDLSDELQPLALPLQQRRPVVGSAPTGILDGANAIGGGGGGSAAIGGGFSQNISAIGGGSADKLLKLSASPGVESPKIRMMMPDPSLTALVTTKVPAKVLPQISVTSPLSRSGRSQTLTSLGEKSTTLQHHRVMKAPSQSALHRATPPSSSRPDIVVMGVAQCRTPTMT